MKLLSALRQAGIAAPPAAPEVGESYYDETLGYSREWNGSSWQRVGGLQIFDQTTPPPATDAPYLRIHRDVGGAIIGVYFGEPD